MSDNIDTPEFKLPFMFTDDGSVLEVEQDSDQDVQQDAYVLCSYEPGQLTAVPEYGLPSQVFKVGGADLDVIQALIEQWDDRAVEIVEDNPAWFMDLVQIISIRRDPNS